MKVKRFLTSLRDIIIPILLLRRQLGEFILKQKVTYDQNINVKWWLLKDNIQISILGSFSTAEASQIVDGLTSMVLNMHLKRFQQNG